MVDSPDAPLIALLVEDNPSDAELIALRLASHSRLPGVAGIELLHATTMLGACTMLRDADVDVVILDVSLPDAHGLEAVIRIHEVAPATPIIVLTGLADQALALEALRAGAQDYVLKPPPDGPSLCRILRYARERQRLLQELDAARRLSARDAERWRLLAEVGETMVNEDSGAAMSEVASLLIPSAADCVVLMIAGDETLPPLVEVAHVDRGRAADLHAAISALFATPGAERDRIISSMSGAQAVDTDLIGALLQPLFTRFGASATAVPLRCRGRVHGLLVLAVTAGGDAAVTDVEFARSLADRIALALEQDRLLRKSQRAVAARDRAVGIVSHDLRNPLNTIDICAAALLDDDPPPVSGVRHMAELIHRSTEWMQQIVQDLLDRSTLDAGRMVLRRHPTAVSDIIGAAKAMFAPIAEEHSIDFVVRTANELPQLDADPSRLLQALANLISNAMKFTPAGGRVVLCAAGGGADVVPTVDEVDSPMVFFSVSDNGPGIPEDDVAHVFDWFWHSQRDAGAGVGLGLAIAKDLIEAHHGRLHVNSVPGRGSTFWFTVPTVMALVAAQTDPAM
jgi:signal transduction histidine kinase